MRLALVLLVLHVPSIAAAFCGVYIDAGGAEMYNNATQVVLMREGTRTVLAMQNNYEGPVKDFAMVVPVPTVLKQTDVRTIPRTLFARVNAMSAPRLVEYWEVNPCYQPERSVDVRDFAKHSPSVPDPTKFGVKIEAQFDVDEYQIVILSATESTGLENYLRAAKYKIPANAAPLLRPYVENGSKFFVAKVDPKKVKFVKGQAELSPLRFHYDSDELVLPIRLGLANSSGVQDLIVNILAPKQRYEVANYPNAYIPTNIDVVDGVRTRFSEFYAALFDRTVQQHPGAVITEYAWAASSCDPCPGYRLTDEDFAKLGEDVLAPRPVPPPPPPRPPVPEGEDIEMDSGPPGPEPRDFVLTRLHARYGKGDAANDLVFRAAPPIQGGGERREANGSLATTPQPSSQNSFQARYVIRHPWTKPIECENPVRGRWGSDPDGGLGGRWRSRISIGAATHSANAPRGAIELHNLVAQDVPQIAIQKGVPLSPPLPKPAPRAARPKGCGCGSTPETGFGALVLAWIALRRRRS